MFGTSEIFSVNINCKPYDAGLRAIDIIFAVTMSYPFSVKSQSMVNCDNQTITVENIDLNYGGSSIFFAFIVILSFIYAIAALVYYVLFEEHFLTTSIPGRKIDLYTSIFFTVFTLISTIAFTVVTASVRSNATPRHLTSKLDHCLNSKIDGFYTTCSHGKNINDADFLITTCLGYINVILWAFNIWFVYKEEG